MIDEKIFATPLKVQDVADCYFYHTMELPGYGVMEGRDWDLRGSVDEYLGKVAFGSVMPLTDPTPKCIMVTFTICRLRSVDSTSL